jgi:hypothetical protein
MIDPYDISNPLTDYSFSPSAGATTNQQVSSSLSLCFVAQLCPDQSP